jgi:uncharacterized protein YkvS|tara:strand:+ start:729 stop:1004 length:276 start_codon:yes stop_codon:yes gene_type:complete
MSKQLQTAITAISQLSTREELKAAFSAVKAQQDIMARQTAMTIAKNATVSFTHNGETLRGTVEKVNPKTIIVNVGVGRNWKVHASLLTVEA